MKSLVKRISELQLQYSSENTDAMKERGIIIRQKIPNALLEFEEKFKDELGIFSHDLTIEGKDGIGRKTEAPWVRIFSKELSPSATTGYYVVIHFSIDGERCYVTLGCASTTWNNETGDLSKLSKQDLLAKTSWARNIIYSGGGAHERFKDQITLGAKAALPKSFEDATVIAELHDAKNLNEQNFLSSIYDALNCLKLVYEASNQLGDVPSSEIAVREVESVINPLRNQNREFKNTSANISLLNQKTYGEKMRLKGQALKWAHKEYIKKNSGGKQGFGLNAAEKKAVELRAMEVTRSHLINLGYSVTDTSANNPFDFLATSNERSLKVEVKGTTSSFVDSVLMTSNEVKLHQEEKGHTALAIVSQIKLTQRGNEPKSEGGNLEFIDRWNIDDYSLKPISFLVSRN